MKGVKITTIDMAGQEKYVTLWESFFQDANVSSPCTALHAVQCTIALPCMHAFPPVGHEGRTAILIIIL